MRIIFSVSYPMSVILYGNEYETEQKGLISEVEEK